MVGGEEEVEEPKILRALKSMLLRSLKMYGQSPLPFSAFPTNSTSSLDTPFSDPHRQLLGEGDDFSHANVYTALTLHIRKIFPT
jgi:hypothetical protein